jgi:hypothetical protein
MQEDGDRHHPGAAVEPSIEERWVEDPLPRIQRQPHARTRLIGDEGTIGQVRDSNERERRCRDEGEHDERAFEQLSHVAPGAANSHDGSAGRVDSASRHRLGHRRHPPRTLEVRHPWFGAGPT